jgi:hypothetical protein
MPLLFSYGTLQQESVQLATFGRRLHGWPDELVGFALSTQRVEDPAFVATSGKAVHAIVRRTGRNDDRVRGTVLEVTDEELAMADAYEPAGWERLPGTVASGTQVWVYGSQ